MVWPLTNHVFWNKILNFLNLSVPTFPHQQNEDNNSLHRAIVFIALMCITAKHNA